MLESWTELDQPSPQLQGKGTQPIWMTLVGASQAHPSALLALHTLLPNAGTSGLQWRYAAAGSWTMACRLIWGGPYPVLGSTLIWRAPAPRPGAHSASMGEALSALPQSQDMECVSPVAPHAHSTPFPEPPWAAELLTALHSLCRALSLRQHGKDAMAARINATVTPRPPRLGSQPGLADTEDATNPTLNFRVPSLPHPEDFTRGWIKAALRGQ